MPPVAKPEITITFEVNADKQIVDAVDARLNAYNRDQMGNDQFESVCLLARDTRGELAAGLLGGLYYEWLYISTLWVREDLRGRGIGSRLLALAEEHAVAQGRNYVHLDTFDFQAPEFYRRLGYTVFGELGPYGDGHVRYYLKKELRSVTATQVAQ